VLGTLQDGLDLVPRQRIDPEEVPRLPHREERLPRGCYDRDVIAFKGGFLHLGSIRDVPIRLHWSMPIGAFVFGHFRIIPWFWLSFFLLVLIHEIGHAIMVWTVRAHVIAIDVNGAGGLCHWEGEVGEIGRALIAWGGVLAQLVLLAATYAWLTFIGPPRSELGAGLAMAFTETNLTLVAINLIPVPGLDGSEAWPLFPALVRRWRARRARVDERKKKRAIAHAAAEEEISRLDDHAEAKNEGDKLLSNVFGDKIERHSDDEK
jgi:Zn-dependent protease